MGNFENSWIKLPRKFTQWRWYKDTNTVQLYIYLLLNANIKDVECRNTTIKRGELITTRKKLSTATGLTDRNTRTCLKRLEKTGEIKCIKSTTGTLVIMLDFNNFQPIGIDDSGNSWIKLYRNMTEWRWHDDPKVCHLIIHIMLRGVLTPSPNGQDISCKLYTSYRSLASETGISIQSLRTCIKKLERTHDIITAYDHASQESVITICDRARRNIFTDGFEKYKQNTKISTQHQPAITTCGSDTYTSINSQSDQRVTNERPTSNTGIFTENAVFGNLPTQHQPAITTYRSDTYVSTNSQSDQQVTNERPTSDQRATNKRPAYNNKNIRIKEIKDNIINNTRACAREEEFVFFEEEKEAEKNKEIFFENLRKDKKWQEAVKRYFKYDKIESVTEKINEFDDYITIRGKENHVNMQDLKSHFFDWMKINLKENANGIHKREKRKGNRSVPKSSEGGVYSDPI